jgi:ribosome-binding protein aMBF1 (putative translation factor)
LAQVLGIAQRKIRVKLDLSNQKFSTRKRFPAIPKTIGDHLMLKRLEADLTQAEVAAKVKVSDKTLREWEYDRSIPTQAQWDALAQILPVELAVIGAKTQH